VRWQIGYSSMTTKSRLLAVLLLGVCLSAGSSVGQEPDLSPGTKDWPAVSNGLVFVEGEFLPPPYVVSRIGNGIYINGRHIESPLPWSPLKPKPAQTATNTVNPTIPEAITKLTTQFDSEFINYINAKKAFLLSKHDKHEVLEMLIKAYKELPCIADAYHEPNTESTIILVWQNGRKEGVNEFPPTRKPVDITPDQAVKLLDGVCEIYAEGLKATNYFMFGSAKRRGTQKSFARTLEPLANALRSAKDEADFLSMMKTNQPPGGMSEKALRSFYKYKDEVPEWERRLRGCDGK